MTPAAGGSDEVPRTTGENPSGEARDAALELLSHRPRSVAEMRRRLGRKGFEATAVEEVVRWLLDRGYLDDRAFARQFLRERLRRRPRGPFALVQELRERGLDRSLATAMVETVMEEEGVDEEAMADSAAARWLARQGPQVRTLLAAADRTEEATAARRRLYGYLERRGFRRGVARRVLERVEAELDPDPDAR